MNALLHWIRLRFGLRARRWPMAIMNKPLPETEHFRLVKRDGLIFIEPKAHA